MLKNLPRQKKIEPCVDCGVPVPLLLPRQQRCPDCQKEKIRRKKGEVSRKRYQVRREEGTACNHCGRAAGGQELCKECRKQVNLGPEAVGGCQFRNGRPFLYYKDAWI